MKFIISSKLIKLLAKQFKSI